MRKIEKKIKKSPWFHSSTVEAIEMYRAISGEDFSNACESLVLRGIENTHTVEESSRRIKEQVAKQIAQDKKNTDRIIAVLMNMTRLHGKIYSHTFSTFKSVSQKENHEIQEFEKHGIVKGFETLKEKSETDKIRASETMALIDEGLKNDK